MKLTLNKLHAQAFLRETERTVSWIQDYKDYSFFSSVIKKEKKLVQQLLLLAGDEYKCEAEIYDDRLLDSERLLKLFENAGITPQRVEFETDKCLKLTIYSAEDSKKIASYEYVYDGKGDILSISR